MVFMLSWSTQSCLSMRMIKARAIMQYIEHSVLFSCSAMIRICRQYAGQYLVLRYLWSHYLYTTSSSTLIVSIFFSSRLVVSLTHFTLSLLHRVFRGRYVCFKWWQLGKDLCDCAFIVHMCILPMECILIRIFKYENFMDCREIYEIYAPQK